MADRTGSLADSLAAIPLFAALSPHDRAALSQAGVRRRLARGQALHRQGEVAGSLAVVLAGRLDVRRITPDGEEITLRRLEPGAVVGLSTALGAAASADVIAAGEVDVLAIPAAALRSLFRRDPEVAVRAVLQLAAWLSDLTDELEAERTRDITERTRRKLAQLARGGREIRLTHEELAARIGASRANVSRALGRLAREGRVRLGRGRIVILQTL